MRRFAIASAVLLVLSSVLLAAGAMARPDLVPAWARLQQKAPPPHEEPEQEPSSLEEGPDDGWLAHLDSSDRKGVRISLPTVRLASESTAARVGFEVVTAGTETVAPTVTGNAEISFVTHDYAHITSRVTGRIAEVPTDEGRTVKKGDVLVVVDSAEVGAAKAAYLSLLPVVELGRKEFRRISGMRPSGAASEKEELTSHATLAKAEAELLNARQRLLNMGYSDDEIAKIAETRDTSNLLKITAPMGGRLVERHAVVGEAVSPPTAAVTSGQMLALFDIADLREMWCWIDIGEADVTKVAIGQQVRFTISGADKPVFSGNVELVSFAVNPATRTVRIRAGLKNEGERLRANQYGRAVIRVGPERRAVVIPRSAVQADAGEQFVFLPLPDGRRFRTQRVEIKPMDDASRVEVVFGLKPGEQVVTTGSFLLKTELLRSQLAAEE